MSIKFNELNQDGPVKTKEQILAEIKRTLYFYDGSVSDLSSEGYWGDDEFEDVPF